MTTLPALRLSTFTGKRDTEPCHIELTFAELAAEEHEERPDKDGLLFSPAEYRDGASRANTGVLRLHVLVLDLDHHLHATAEQVVERLLEMQIESWVYSTHSYDEHAPEGASLRIVCALSRPVEPKEWPKLWTQARHEIAPESDPARKDLAGMYYMPSCKPGAARVNEYLPGEPIDVDACLERAEGGGARASSVIAEGDDIPSARRIAPPEIDDAMREWALARVSALAKSVERAPFPGPIYPTLNHAAYVAGRFVPHVLSLETARMILRESHTKRTRDPALVEKNDAIMDRGLADGMAMPWRPSKLYELNDAGLSSRLLDDHGEHLRYVIEWGKWLGFDGTRWRSSSDAAPAILAMRDLARALREEAEYVGGKRAQALRASATYVNSSKGARSILYMASPLPRFRVSIDELDLDPNRFICENGTIDLSRGVLTDHVAEHLCIAKTRATYDPDALAPTWMRFLEEVCCGDLELMNYLQRAVGYTLTGHTREQCLFFLYGDGRNGKSTFITVLQRLFDEYSTTVPADVVLAKRNEQHPTAIASLYSKRLAVVAEVEDGRPWDEALIKNLTGSDLISARRMREDPWVFTARHKLWISGNYRPAVRGVDNGIWRRMRLIPFTASFAGREDHKLYEKLIAELPGILAWAVRGAVAWTREGLVVAPSIAAATEQYRIEQDFFSTFLDEMLEVTKIEEHRLPRAQVHQMYEQWAQRNGAPDLSGRGIAERIRRRGVGEHKGNGTQYWTCIRVRPKTHDAVRADRPS